MTTAKQTVAAEQSIDPARRQFVLGGSLLLAATAAAALKPVPDPAIVKPGELDIVIPHRLGDWQFSSASGLVLPPRDQTEVRTYDQVLTRVYAPDDGSLPVMLLIAYGGGQTGLFTVHRPEACYPAQGYRLSGRRLLPILSTASEKVVGTFWTAVSDVRIEQLLYWTRIGNVFPHSWAEEKLATASANLVRRVPDGALVRMSALTTDADEAVATLARFSAALIRNTQGRGRRILLGDL